jgi:transcriptional regulator GlxA family with amidase domain
MFTTSVCTGSLLLATAGLLDGLTAATHWGTAGEIEGYGAVYTPERVVRHDRIITSAGVSSGIDMALPCRQTATANGHQQPAMARLCGTGDRRGG